MTARDDRNALELLIVAQRFYAIGKTTEAVRIAEPVLSRINLESRQARENAIDLEPLIRSVRFDAHVWLDVMNASRYFQDTSLSSVTAIGWNKYFEDDDHRTLLGRWVRDGKQYDRLDHPASADAIVGLGLIATLVAVDLASSTPIDLVVAVPSSVGSQNALPASVARAISANLGLAFPDSAPVQRVRAIPPLKTIWGIKEKLDAIHGTMSADTRVVQGRSVLIIDDLLESGATLRETARAIRAVGAADVHGLCLLKTRRYAREMMNV